jgi:DNA polymerase (family 10)
MTKEQIAGVLERIAMLLELKGENPFKIRAYTNAARAIEIFGGNVSNLQNLNRRLAIRSIGFQTFFAMQRKVSGRNGKRSASERRP